MTTILTVPVALGNTKLDGQVAVLDIDGVNIYAPSKRRNWFRLQIDAAFPPEGAPSQTDISWLYAAKIYVLIVMPEGTFSTDSLPQVDDEGDPIDPS